MPGDLTEAALVEAMARAMHANGPHTRWENLPDVTHGWYRSMARAALAAIREAAGLDADLLQAAARHVAPFGGVTRESRNVAALLRALAGGDADAAAP